MSIGVWRSDRRVEALPTDPTDSLADSLIRGLQGSYSEPLMNRPVYRGGVRVALGGWAKFCQARSAASALMRPSWMRKR